jgi:hypothetical protein
LDLRYFTRRRSRKIADAHNTIDWSMFMGINLEAVSKPHLRPNGFVVLEPDLRS